MEKELDTLLSVMDGGASGSLTHVQEAWQWVELKQVSFLGHRQQRERSYLIGLRSSGWLCGCRSPLPGTCLSPRKQLQIAALVGGRRELPVQTDFGVIQWQEGPERDGEQEGCGRA